MVLLKYYKIYKSLYISSLFRRWSNIYTSLVKKKDLKLLLELTIHLIRQFSLLHPEIEAIESEH